MSFPEAGDVLAILTYSEKPAETREEVKWSQQLREKRNNYHPFKAQDKSKGNITVIFADFIAKVSDAQKEGDDWIVTIDDRFHMLYQHIIWARTIQGNGPDRTKTLAKQFSSGDFSSFGSLVGERLQIF
ncbi:hypothetical protein AK830_g5682 [Neonectria ditissima]|uniref:Uncharacterized protein n=1 Tax=Neonectria ditissima TaxID=78410 RepID=A0A0P7BDV0_9HYPO|nr:hypothetical protein AK830_g5682 [Neonectria ditissima]